MATIKEKFWIDPTQAALVVIDVQEKLAPAMNPKLYIRLKENLPLLIEGCKTVGVPVIASEQYPKGLGATLPLYQAATEEACVAKTTFSCCGEEDFVTALKKTGATQVIVTGMETHVCVLQTVLDLLDQGLTVHLVSDAVASRFLSDYNNALSLATQAGAVVTTLETVLFQLIKGAGEEHFKAISSLVRKRQHG